MLNLRTGEHFRDRTKTMTRRDALKGLAGIGAILASGTAPAILRNDLEMRTVAMTGDVSPLPKGYTKIESFLRTSDSYWFNTGFRYMDELLIEMTILRTTATTTSQALIFTASIGGARPALGFDKYNGLWVDPTTYGGGFLTIGKNIRATNDKQTFSYRTHGTTSTGYLQFKSVLFSAIINYYDWNIKSYATGDLLANYLACRKDSNGYVGFYNTVNNTFYRATP